MMRNGTRRSRSVAWFAWVVTGSLAAVIGGCGRDGPERVAVSGKVTFCGEPVKTGEIRFSPTKGTEGPTEGAVIIDGQYLANGKGGVPVGTYTVNIVAWNGRAPTRDMPLPDAPSGRQDKESSRKQLLPAQYNTQSQLEITIQSGSKNVVQDFALTN
jgi:hypothetical protein